MQKSICSFEGCVKTSHARGICVGHYQQYLKGAPLKPLGKRSLTHAMTEPQRFQFYAKKSDGCWEWQGTVQPDGYGVMKWNGKKRMAHRISYELYGREVPDGMQLDHKCHNRKCVNPEHLREVTPKQNSENVAGARIGTRSQHRGVSWYSKTGKWRAQVGHNYKLIHLGYFDSELEAAHVVEAKRMELFTHSDGR